MHDEQSRTLSHTLTSASGPAKPAPDVLNLPAGPGDGDAAALMRALMQTCRELQRRVESLELSERIRARQHPKHDLSIDY